ncbi:hypothetical protein ASN_944 [Acetobacter senegalensis]|uniref:Uncharacterized protein n=1 Tax=Acetobacter senegalensis TaxID=446692 RepID=A0A0U5EXK3_9PROT|nr:hypothetical protein ASN_944 [Acetobacter senegalensis]
MKKAALRGGFFYVCFLKKTGYAAFRRKRWAHSLVSPGRPSTP